MKRLSDLARDFTRDLLYIPFGLLDETERNGQQQYTADFMAAAFWISCLHDIWQKKPVSEERCQKIMTQLFEVVASPYNSGRMKKRAFDWITQTIDYMEEQDKLEFAAQCFVNAWVDLEKEGVNLPFPLQKIAANLSRRLDPKNGILSLDLKEKITTPRLAQRLESA